MSSQADFGRIEDIQSRMSDFAKVQKVLRVSGADSDRQPRLEPTDMKTEQPEYPKWQSGIEQLDGVAGGFMGLTIVGGESGCGKSMFSLGNALGAAEAGDCVVYFDAENDAGLQRKRIRRWYRTDPEFSARFMDIAGVNFHYVRVRHGNEIVQLARAAADFSKSFHLGTLLVFDSVNSVVRRISKAGENPLERVGRMLSWMDEVTQDTQGRVRFLAISELNKEGGIKGLEAVYIGTVVLTIKNEPDAGDDVVRIYLDKHRDWRSKVDLGLFLRSWKTLRFERIEDRDR